MRKYSVLIVLLVLLCLAGCGQHAHPTTEPPTQPTTVKQSAQSLDFQAQYIRTNGGWAGYAFPNAVVIGDVQELEDYYRNYRNIFDLERKEQVYSDTTIGFLDACDAYDEAFFAENYLLLIVLEEGSGSISHQVNKVEQTPDREIQVQIESIVPEVGTADMAQWHIVLALPRDGALPEPQDVYVYMYEKLIWNGGPIDYPVPPELMQPNVPEGLLICSDGQIPLVRGGYSWTYRYDDGTETNVIADQAGRLTDDLEPVIVDEQLCKLQFSLAPERVEITCFGVQSDEEISLEVLQNVAFKPLIGSYFYEIKATWQYGTANYYVCLSRGLGLFMRYTMPLELPESPEFEEILQQLTFRKEKVCKCKPQYQLTTADGRVYGVHLAESYIRCDEGQADLTAEQRTVVKNLIDACIDQTMEEIP